MTDSCDVRCITAEHATQLRAQRLSDAAADVAAIRMRALADPVRLRIMTALRDGGELCVCDLSWVCDASVALVSHHLKALREAGHVARRREGRLMMYQLHDSCLPLLALAIGDEVAA